VFFAFVSRYAVSSLAAIASRRAISSLAAVASRHAVGSLVPLAARYSISSRHAVTSLVAVASRRAPSSLAAATSLLAIATSYAVGADAADAVRYRIQPEASELTFKATSRLMNADGRFHRFGGDVVVDPQDPTTAQVTLSVEAASIDTGIARRDRHLRSEDFFHVERFPTIAFESVRVEPAGRVEAAGQRLNVVGRLTLRGVTRQIMVPLEVELTPTALVARGEFAINRTDYGMTYTSFFNPVGAVVRVAFVFRARADQR
jgi:polyisoprenoid-binding protein YceI